MVFHQLKIKPMDISKIIFRTKYCSRIVIWINQYTSDIEPMDIIFKGYLDKLYLCYLNSMEDHAKYLITTEESEKKEVVGKVYKVKSFNGRKHK